MNTNFSAKAERRKKKAEADYKKAVEKEEAYYKKAAEKAYKKAEAEAEEKEKAALAEKMINKMTSFSNCDILLHNNDVEVHGFEKTKSITYHSIIFQANKSYFFIRFCKN